MNAQLNDKELIKQYLSTNPNVCFETLYSRYVNKVYRRCLSMTKDAEKAEGYTQDILMRTFNRLDRFQERSTLRPCCIPFHSTTAWIRSNSRTD